MQKGAAMLLAGTLVSACGGSGSENGADLGGDASPATSSGDPQMGGTLVIGQDQGPDHIDPHGTSMAFQHRVVVDGPYESLLRLDPEMNLQPSLATEWVEEGPTSFLFKLRQDVTFHDGAAFTADDVVFTFERILDPERPSTSGDRLSPVSSVTAVDEHTVRFELESPFAPFLPYMASPDISGIIDREFTEAHNNDLSVDANGTGPFRVTNFVPGEVIELERYESYWMEDRPYLDGYEIRVIADDAARIAALRTGEIDMSYFRPDKKPLIDALDSVVVPESLAFGAMEPMDINCDAPGLDKLEVRQALALAIDEEAIMDTVLGEELSAPTLRVPAGHPVYGYQGDGSDLPHWGTDIEQAKELLASAGYADGIEFGIMYINTPAFAMNNRIAEIAREQAAEAGITLTLEPTEYAAYLQRSGAGDFELGSAGRTMEVDPDAYFSDSHSASSRVRCPDPEVDSLIEAQRRELDPDRRAEIVDELDRYLAEKVYILSFFADPIRIEVWQENVHGYQPYPHIRRTSLVDVWMEQ